MLHRTPSGRSSTVTVAPLLAMGAPTRQGPRVTANVWPDKWDRNPTLLSQEHARCAVHHLSVKSFDPVAPRGLEVFPGATTPQRAGAAVGGEPPLRAPRFGGNEARRPHCAGPHLRRGGRPRHQRLAGVAGTETGSISF